MRVNILISRDIISYYQFFFVMIHIADLARMGCHVRFCRSFKEAQGSADVLVMDNRFFTPLWREHRAEALDRLALFRKTFSRVIWMDVTDSTGATQFQVLPYVDLYLKKQLLKDRTLYATPFYGARIYADFYKKQYHLPVEKVYCDEPLPLEFLSRLAVSWNLGLGPFHRAINVNDICKWTPDVLRCLVDRRQALSLYKNRMRSQDICFRGTDTYRSLALSFQRLEVIKKLKARGIDTTPLSFKAYHQELQQSRIAVSPFGAGEICFRDFEAMIAGSLVFKPDMGHMDTWPDLFVAHHTYEPFNWNFDNFDLSLDLLLSDPNRINEMVETAQSRYASYFSDVKCQEFCQRFVSFLAC